MRQKLFIFSGLLLASSLLWTAGCTTARAPELQSTSQTGPQDAITVSRVNSNNLRQIWDDAARIMFLDRNSRLTPFVVP